jgi:hypothetical protein
MQLRILAGDGGRKPVTEEIMKQTVKTIVQGMPECFGVPATPQ